MTTSKYNQIVASMKEDSSYWHEVAKLDFAFGLNEVMNANHLSRADLARALQTSPAYVTKVLGGNCNFTIATMVDLARAAGGELILKVAQKTHASLAAKEVTSDVYAGAVISQFQMERAPWADMVRRSASRAKRACEFNFHDFGESDPLYSSGSVMACNDRENENEPLAA